MLLLGAMPTDRWSFLCFETDLWCMKFCMRLPTGKDLAVSPVDIGVYVRLLYHPSKLEPRSWGMSIITTSARNKGNRVNAQSQVCKLR